MKSSSARTLHLRCRRLDWQEDKPIFIIHNITDKHIMLSDLKAEIKPRGILDLERVVTRAAIEGSRDLKHALKSKRLQLGRHSVIKTKSMSQQPQVIRTLEKTIERERELDEDRLAELIRSVVKEESSKTESPLTTPEPTQDVGDVVQKAVSSGMNDLLSSIRDQINSIQPQGTVDKQIDEIPIDPKKFAEMSQKSVEKISDNIETSGPKKAKKIKFRTKNIQDLADEI